MNKNLFFAIISQLSKLKEEVIVFSSDNVHKNNLYTVSEKWKQQTEIIKDSATSKRYVRFVPQTAGATTNSKDGIFIDVISANFKYEDFPYVKVSFRTNINDITQTEDDNYLNFMVEQTEKWDFGSHIDKCYWPSVTNIRRDETCVEFTVKCYPYNIGTPEGARAKSVRFLPYWYESRKNNLYQYPFNTKQDDYFDIEYIAFFKSKQAADAFNYSQYKTTGIYIPSYKKGN